MKATVTSKGQITIPQAIRHKLKLQAGSVLEFDEHADHLKATTQETMGMALDIPSGLLNRAHAQQQADRIAATDRGYLRRYFPRLKILKPR